MSLYIALFSLSSVNVTRWHLRGECVLLCPHGWSLQGSIKEQLKKEEARMPPAKAAKHWLLKTTLTFANVALLFVSFLGNAKQNQNKSFERPGERWLVTCFDMAICWFISLSREATFPRIVSLLSRKAFIFTSRVSRTLTVPPTQTLSAKQFQSYSVKVWSTWISPPLCHSFLTKIHMQ